MKIKPTPRFVTIITIFVSSNILLLMFEQSDTYLMKNQYQFNVFVLYNNNNIDLFTPWLHNLFMQCSRNGSVLVMVPDSRRLRKISKKFPREIPQIDIPKKKSQKKFQRNTKKFQKEIRKSTTGN